MPGPRETPSRASSYSSIASSVNDPQNAALLGATAAFGRPKPRERVPSNTYNGALTAASTTSTASKTPSPKHATRKSPSPAAVASALPTSDVTSTQDNERRAGRPLDSVAKPNLTVPKQAQTDRSKSPSHQAAQLAAARSPEPSAGAFNAKPRAKTTRGPAVTPKPRQLSVHNLEDRPTDSSPTPPTTSLVELFEKRSNDPRTSKRPGPIVVRPTRELAVSSPKPVRVSNGGISSVFQMELEETRTPKAAPTIEATDYEPGAQYDGHSSSDEYVSASEDTAGPASSPITIRKRVSRADSASTVASDSVVSNVEQRMRPPPSPLKPTSIRPIQTQQLTRRITSPTTYSASPQSSQSIMAQYNKLHPRRVTPLQTGDELANAIVASSLASSRAPSPLKLEPPPVPTARRKHHVLGFSRTPSPTKQLGLRQTLRKAESSDSESEYDELHPYGKHKKKRHLRKHPNKHHEGDRKRWREAVTERERKRYEGVWAANKGMHCDIPDQVSNIVTRDIWSRSRLSDAVLEMVWDLVDSSCVGRLSREEFVVGMWLIDQRLKGRKLPVKVSESVWASVRSLQGIKIRK